MTDQTLVADDKAAGAFGPGARDLKIRNLRTYPFPLDVTTLSFEHVIVLRLVFSALYLLISKFSDKKVIFLYLNKLKAVIDYSLHLHTVDVLRVCVV